MTQPILRVLIQNNFAIGRLPHSHIPRIWGGPRAHPAMSKGLLRGLALAAFAALGTLTCVASAGAAEAITSCPTTLNTFGGTYVLADDLESCGTCLVVANDRITIDLAGHTISGLCGGDGVSDGGTARQGTTVKNGAITGFEVGVLLPTSTRNQILNLTSSANSAIGIIVGEYSLVKGSAGTTGPPCLIENNGQNGIIFTCTLSSEGCASFGRIQDCTIAGHVTNGGFGIIGGDRMFVRGNSVEDNGVGILVGDFSNVSFNDSSNNVATGLFAGKRALVTGNTTKWNGTAGITTGGNTNVSHNTSNNNGGGGINVVVIDPLLDDGTRNLVTGNTTNDNGLVGITAMCPGTVTNNKSSGNGSGIWDNYDIGLGCRNTNNK